MDKIEKYLLGPTYLAIYSDYSSLLLYYNNINI